MKNYNITGYTEVSETKIKHTSYGWRKLCLSQKNKFRWKYLGLHVEEEKEKIL